MEEDYVKKINYISFAVAFYSTLYMGAQTLTKETTHIFRSI